jgi:hypothetical protein
MRAACLAAAIASASLVVGQSPCPPNAGPASLTTLFAGTGYPASPDPVFGANVLFDWNSGADLDVDRIDVNLVDDGSGTGPDLVGSTAPLRVWITLANPGTWIGNGTTPAAWTLLATGTLTVAAPDRPSTAVFAPPFVLPRGSYGVALQHLPVGTPHPVTGPVHPLITDPFVRPTPLTFRDEYATWVAGGVQDVAFASGVQQPAVANVAVHYTPGLHAAFTAAYGSGCYDRPRSFYEQFTVPPAAFDLGDSTIRLAYGGAIYTVTRTTVPPVLFTPLGPPLGNALGAPMGDDDISGPLVLPFPFAYPTGTTVLIQVGSNGCVFLEPPVTGGTAPFSGSARDLLDDSARLAPFWGDLDPASGTGAGDVYFDIDPSGQTVYVTWLGLQERGTPAVASTVQLALHANGDVEFRYRACAIAAAPVLVGWSPGGGAPDPRSRDLSAGGFVSGDGAEAPLFGTAARPVLGTVAGLVTSRIRSGTAAGVVFVGLVPLSPGIPLGGIRMPGCTLWLSPLVSEAFVPNATSGAVFLPLPNDPALDTGVLVAQSAVLTPGLNPLGVLVTHGLCIRLGTQ